MGEYSIREAREKRRENDTSSTIYATFADLISAHHARVAADVRCHLVGNCYRFKLIEQYARINKAIRVLSPSFSLLLPSLPLLHSQFNNK